MVFAVNQRHLEIHHREPRHHAGTEDRLQTFLDAGNEFLRHRAADNLVLELERRPGRRGLGDDLDLRELTRAAGLLLVGVAMLDTLSDLLAESDLRRTDICIDLVSALKDVDFDVEMQFAHSLENGLPALLIGGNAEGWILGRELRERNAKLLLVRF